MKKLFLSLLFLCLAVSANAQTVVTFFKPAAVAGCSGDGFAFVASASNSTSGSDTSLSTSSTLDVAAGDLLVVFVGWEDGASTMSVSDGGSNSFTFLTTNDDGSNYGAIGYKIGATANETATFTATWGTARAYRSISVLQFRPDSGETVTLDVSDVSNSGSGTSMASGSVTTTGCDEVVVGAAKNYGTHTFESEQVAGAAADGTLRTSNISGMWYSIFDETKSTITATATGANSSWVCNIISFKSN